MKSLIRKILLSEVNLILEMPKKLDTDEFIRRSKEKHGDLYDYSRSVYVNATVPVEIICPEHGPWKTLPNVHYKGHGCPTCGFEKTASKKTKTTDNFIVQAKNVYGEKYDYSDVVYSKGDEKVTVNCKNHGPFQVTPNKHLQGQGCPTCAQEKKIKDRLLPTDEFIKKSQKVHGNLYDYSPSEYTGLKNKVKIVCKEHGPFDILPGNHYKGQGCPICGDIKQGISSRDNTEIFIQKARKVHGNKFDYSLVDYFKSNTPVEIICKEHGPFSVRPNNHLNGQGCPVCQESKGEKIVSIILDKFKIPYLRQYKFKDCFSDRKMCYKLPFDFYLPDYNSCIEFDGKQHFEPVNLFGGDNGFKRRQKLDEIKNLYCKKNKINLIRIPYNIQKDSLTNYILSRLGIE